jgi:hypothetical protein
MEEAAEEAALDIAQTMEINKTFALDARSAMSPTAPAMMSIIAMIIRMRITSGRNAFHILVSEKTTELESSAKHQPDAKQTEVEAVEVEAEAEVVEEMETIAKRMLSRTMPTKQQSKMKTKTQTPSGSSKKTSSAMSLQKKNRSTKKKSRSLLQKKRRPKGSNAQLQ